MPGGLHNLHNLANELVVRIREVEGPAEGILGAQKGCGPLLHVDKHFGSDLPLLGEHRIAAPHSIRPNPIRGELAKLEEAEVGQEHRPLFKNSQWQANVFPGLSSAPLALRL